MFSFHNMSVVEPLSPTAFAKELVDLIDRYNSDQFHFTTLSSNKKVDVWFSPDQTVVVLNRQQEDNPGDKPGTPIVTDEEEEEKNHGAERPWTVVSYKKKSKPATPEYFVFSDEANSTLWNFEGVVHSLDEVKQIATDHQWAHAIETGTQLVYDFYHPHDRTKFRRFAPDVVYTTQFQSWLYQYELAGEKVPKDHRIFYVFSDASTWTDTWTFQRLIMDIHRVWRYVKSYEWKWSHAYCPETRDLYDFKRTNMSHKLRFEKASERYMKQFRLYKQQHPEIDHEDNSSGDESE